MQSKIKLFIAMLFISIITMAQSPNMISYQGVARNTNGSAIANQNIKVRLKVRQGTASGTVKYSEVRSLTTDASGLFTIQIGSTGASSITGNWGAIKWESGAKYLQVEMDATGGNNFIDMGTQQLLSVPYAQYSNLAGGLILPYNAVDSTTFAPVIITNLNTAQTAAAINGSGNGGAGVIGNSILNSGVKGTSSAAYYGAVEGFNSVSGGKGVVGIANTGTNSMGVQGNANAGIGVSGYSNTNMGVQGGSISGTGVYGNTLTGSALKGISSSGYGLEVSGKVKIAGGNTNPGNGKVLTSDASGNATWQAPAATPKVAFKAASATVSIPSGQTANVNWTSELYDINNNFDLNTKIFTVPVSGVYHFDASFYFNLSSLVHNLSNATIIIKLNHNGTITYLCQNDGVIHNSSANSQSHCSSSVDARLQLGDQVSVIVYQSNDGGLAANAAGANDPTNHYFSGHLIIAD